MTDRPVGDYRASREGAAQIDRLNALHLNLLDEGFIVSSSGLGCLSTPMDEDDVDAFVGALSRAVGRLGR